MSRITSANVCLQGTWLPCEYQVNEGVVAIRSLGDVECDGIARPIAATLQSAAEQVFRDIPENRKIVVLVPQENRATELWPWRQILKKTLTELAARAAA